jgi:hypothetical protein
MKENERASNMSLAQEIMSVANFSIHPSSPNEPEKGITMTQHLFSCRFHLAQAQMLDIWS